MSFSRNIVVLACCSFISTQAMFTRMAALRTTTRLQQTHAPVAKTYSTEQKKASCGAQCDCFTPAIINRATFDENAPQLWQQHHEQAIRHKVDHPAIDLKAIENHEWVVTNMEGKTWDDYTKRALIKFARQKKVYCIGTNQNCWHSPNRVIDFRNRFDIYKRGIGPKALLFSCYPPFLYKVDEDKISLSSSQDNSVRFSMAINIDDIKIPDVSDISQFSHEIKSDTHRGKVSTDLAARVLKKMNVAVDCINHCKRQIPWYIALKSLDRHNIKDLKKHQKMVWASVSANGYNMLTKTTSNDLFLWSIEHLVDTKQKLVSTLQK